MSKKFGALGIGVSCLRILTEGCQGCKDKYDNGKRVEDPNRACPGYVAQVISVGENSRFHPLVDGQGLDGPALRVENIPVGPYDTQTVTLPYGFNVDSELASHLKSTRT